MEEWRPVVGHEGAYEVSNMGRVRSIPHVVRVVPFGRAETTRVSPGRILRPGPNLTGHVTVAIGRKSRLVHALVAEAFLGPRPQGKEVLHLNHKPSDNRLENLRYGTRSENLKMDYANGSRKQTHCKRGHALSGDNLFPSSEKYSRQCRACSRDRAKRLWAERKQA